MTDPNPFAVVANTDGTISILDKVLDGEATAALVTDILAQMTEAARLAGKPGRAVDLTRGEALHGIRPDAIASDQAPKGHDQRLILVSGRAHIAVVIPTHIVRALGENLLALAAPEDSRH